MLQVLLQNKYFSMLELSHPSAHLKILNGHALLLVPLNNYLKVSIREPNRIWKLQQHQCIHLTIFMVSPLGLHKAMTQGWQRKRESVKTLSKKLSMKEMMADPGYRLRGELCRNTERESRKENIRSSTHSLTKYLFNKWKRIGTR